MADEKTAAATSKAGPLRHGAVVLLALLALAACKGQPAGQGADAAELRQRVERLEREATADRERLDADLRALREDVSALRASLDEASQHLSALSGTPAQAAHQNATAAKSPRAALRDSLRGAVDASRQALERLNTSLEKSLARPKPQAPASPAPAPGPAPDK